MFVISGNKAKHGSNSNLKIKFEDFSEKLYLTLESKYHKSTRLYKHVYVPEAISRNDVTRQN